MRKEAISEYNSYELSPLPKFLMHAYARATHNAGNDKIGTE